MPHLVNSTCEKNWIGEKTPQTLVLNVGKPWVTSALDGSNSYPMRSDTVQAMQCDKTTASKQKTLYFWSKGSLSFYVQTG